MTDKQSTKLSAEELQVELWRLKKQIQRLEALETNGNSVVSLIAPPTEEISKMYQMLNMEATQADCIKSRVNRQAVQTAITMAANRVMSYGRFMPKNGICVFTGEAYENGKQQKIAITFEPCKPITNFLYSCDSKFHTEEIKDLLSMDETYGFVIMDGHGCMFATLCGNYRKIIHRMLVDLPKKHGRGGQSSVRFARLREEARHNYVKIVAEKCQGFFIDLNTNLPNVNGLIFAGSADFKDVLAGSELLDARLKKIIIKHVDISYGMESGFQQAIELSADVLNDVILLKETKIINEFLDQIARDTRKYCYGLVDVVRCLEMGCVDTIIVWEDFPFERRVYKQQDVEYICYINPKTEQQILVDTDIKQKSDDEMVSQQNFVEYLVEFKKKFNISIQLVTDNSSEGVQFCQGFGGLGGLLRWQVDMNELGKFMEQGKQDEVESDLEDFM